jgi:cytochrome d ubiquinol oxidase subunit II
MTIFSRPPRIDRDRSRADCYIVQPSLTIWQAAAAPATQVFMLLGTLVMLPIILGYTIFVYWTFSGKVREGEG